MHLRMTCILTRKQAKLKPWGSIVSLPYTRSHAQPMVHPSRHEKWCIPAQSSPEDVVTLHVNYHLSWHQLHCSLQTGSLATFLSMKANGATEVNTLWAWYTLLTLLVFHNTGLDLLVQGPMHPFPYFRCKVLSMMMRGHTHLHGKLYIPSQNDDVCATNVDSWLINPPYEEHFQIKSKSLHYTCKLR